MKLKNVLVASLLAISLFSCSWKPSEQEIKAMEDERAAALKAEGTVSKKEAELKALKEKHARAKAKADKAFAELERVTKEIESKEN